ncbi:phosphotransferase family protein [Devosia sp.]|uniref:phosphotransferase family protein n=1 Tax=Devosia sp. TaxID=1871048 RepID=UPI002FCAD6B8
MPTSLPSERHAIAIAREVLNWPDATARRFTTGMAFFVYEVAHGDELAVVRLGRPEQAKALADGRELMERLRPLAVPLPEILAHGMADGLPYVVMSRLPGADLGDVIHDLAPSSLRNVAEAVADAQLATARSSRGDGFGYAPTPALAPHATWTGVVRAHIERSRQRIVANGLFPPSTVAKAERLLAGHAAALARVEPIPFLHDTTTKNVIVSPTGQLSGIVDIDDLCYGDPRYPAALTTAAMLAWGGPQDYVTAWLARAGLARDGVFDFYVATFLLDFMSEHGTRFNGNETSSDPAERARLSAVYAGAVARAGGKT